MKFSYLVALAIGAAVAAASPASASVTFTGMTGSDSGPYGDGNGRVFTGTDGTTTVNVRVTGWSFDGTTVRDSYVGRYSGGLGVISGDDGNGSNGRHTADNQGRTDFFILQFDQSVEFVSAIFNTYSVSGSGRDSDAIIGVGNTALDWMSQLALNEQSGLLLSSLFGTSFDSAGGSTGGFRLLNPDGYSGNIWLVAAGSLGLDTNGRIDGFKFSGLTVNTSPLPEPGTWAMMLIGFGAVGGIMRRRRRAPHIAAIA